MIWRRIVPVVLVLLFSSAAFADIMSTETPSGCDDDHLAVPTPTPPTSTPGGVCSNEPKWISEHITVDGCSDDNKLFTLFSDTHAKLYTIEIAMGDDGMMGSFKDEAGTVLAFSPENIAAASQKMSGRDVPPSELEIIQAIGGLVTWEEPTTTGPSPTVPEPATMGLLALGALGLLARRRRARSV